MSGSTATIDAPATPSQKTFTSFETMLDQSELPVLVDFHTHWSACVLCHDLLATHCVDRGRLPDCTVWRKR